MKEYREAFLEVFGEPLATVTLDSDSPSRPAVEPPEQPASGSVATGEGEDGDSDELSSVH